MRRPDQPRCPRASHYARAPTADRAPSNAPKAVSSRTSCTGGTAMVAGQPKEETQRPRMRRHARRRKEGSSVGTERAGYQRQGKIATSEVIANARSYSSLPDSSFLLTIQTRLDANRHATRLLQSRSSLERRPQTRSGDRLNHWTAGPKKGSRRRVNFSGAARRPDSCDTRLAIAAPSQCGGFGYATTAAPPNDISSPSNDGAEASDSSGVRCGRSRTQSGGPRSGEWRYTYQIFTVASEPRTLVSAENDNSYASPADAERAGYEAVAVLNSERLR